MAGAEERRHREDRARARRTEHALRPQVEPQAERRTRWPRTRRGRRAASHGGQPSRRATAIADESARARRSLGEDDARGIAIGQRPADDVVARPGERRDDHREGAPPRRHGGRPSVDDEQGAAGDHREHRQRDALADGLVPEDAREEHREDRLEVEEQRGRHAARPLQAPGERHGSDDGAQRGHDEDPPQRAPPERRARSPCGERRRRGPHPRRAGPPS